MHMRFKGVFEMSLDTEFRAMMTRAWDAIDDGLSNGVAEKAETVLRQVIEADVYSYNATERAMRVRRGANGGLLDVAHGIESRIDVGAKTHTLSIETTVGFQNPAPLQRLDVVVDSGDRNYKQPYPRPFYPETEKLLVSSGIVSSELVLALTRAGFEVY